MKSELIVLIFILCGLWSTVTSEPFMGRHGKCKSRHQHRKEYPHHPHLHHPHQHHPHPHRFHDLCKCHKSPYDVIQPHQSFGLFRPVCGNKNCQQCGLFGPPPPAHYDNNGWGVLGCDNKKTDFLGLPLRFPTLIKAGLGGYIALPGQLGGFSVDVFKIDS